jgi:hypothetical protein
MSQMDLDPPDLVEEKVFVVDRKTGITVWLQYTKELEYRVLHFCDPRWRAEAIKLSVSMISVMLDGSIRAHEPGLGRWGFSVELANYDLRKYILTLDSNRNLKSTYLEDLDFYTFKRFLVPALRIAGAYDAKRRQEMEIHFKIGWTYAKETYDKLVSERSDAFAKNLRDAGIRIDRIEKNPWFEDLTRTIPGPLPASYGTFIQHYRFDPFRWNELAFFGTSGRYPTIDLPTLMSGDPLWTGLLEVHLVQIGLPRDDGMNPVCFNLRSPRHFSETNVVVLDLAESRHTKMLTFKPKIAESFFHYMGALLAGHSQPVPIVPA